LRLRIHRGANEIGGNCIEVEASGKSILLDIGLPLSAKGADKSLVPAVPGLLNGANADLLGIVISHPHIDHFGLVGFTHNSIPIFMGKKAHALVKIAAPFTGTELPDERISHYGHHQSFVVGPFRLTPFLMDHSAFDA